MPYRKATAANRLLLRSISVFGVFGFLCARSFGNSTGTLPHSTTAE